MNKLIAIGEILIDFTASERGKIKDVSHFIKNPGGAPANVAAQAAQLGCKAKVVSKLGVDGFGDFLVETLQRLNVDTSSIFRTKEYNTALAFVSLDETGERDFTFYRYPSADLYLSPNEIEESWFNPGDILHFCSVDLVDYPVKKSHDVMIEYARKHRCIISFDPNLRFSLWADHQALKQTVWEYIPYAHILKLSEDELSFLSGCDDEEMALKKFFIGSVSLILLTRGDKGATLFTHDKRIDCEGIPVQVIDTTGAGDSFIGSFLSRVLMKQISLETLDKNHLDKTDLAFACKAASIVVTRLGAMNSMPSLGEVTNEE